jgi:release factor glutamine methyltransferase
MANSKTLFRDIVSQIHLSFDKEEVESIVYRLMEARFNLKRTDILMDKEVSVDIEMIRDSIDRINLYEPIQYILNEEYFFGRKFYVDPSVLIPRPETEELIRHVLSFPTTAPKIVDIGTGSGCIAITLALQIKKANVSAIDISDEALAVAEKNNMTLDAGVKFLKHDILNNPLPFDELDWIVSNPPYISTAEKENMSENVLAYEPHLALFAGDDPLIFYKTIAKQAKEKLKSGGKIIMEINENLGTETADVFSSYQLTEIKILKDINAKDRFIIATKK